MSPKLPVVSGDEAIGTFKRIGYIIVRQRGNHIRLRDLNDRTHKPLTVPRHKELRPGLLRKLIKDANLTVDEFVRLLTD